MILSLSGVSKSFGTDVILEKITFNMEEKEKAAIVGVNGAGKTTLFKIITGESTYDSGDVYIKKDISLGYLKQNAMPNSDDTIYNEMLSVFKNLIETENELRQMEHEMSSLKGTELEEHMKKYYQYNRTPPDIIQIILTHSDPLLCFSSLYSSFSL